MTPTRFLIGQIIVVYAIVIGGLWLATQWTAFELGYQPQFGAPWVRASVLAGLLPMAAVRMVVRL
jgi:type IV secretion system protein VirD4